MNPNFRAAEKHEYIVPEDGDPRWEAIFAQAPRIVTRFHGPLPPGDVADLCVMFIVRNTKTDGYEEIVYFANKEDVERWSGVISDKLSSGDAEGECLYERLCRKHPEWTVSQIINYAEAEL